MKKVDFLDVTFNLQTRNYKPYKKPNDNTIYINTSSNHPSNIIKQIPRNISKRINEISSDKEIFENAAPFYNNALKASGYKETIEFNTEKDRERHKDSRKRKRNIIWFNPPYNMRVQTNIAKKFLQLIDKHFPKNNRLHKIFNRNNIKVSYSCMPNISSIIRSHNQKVLSEEPADQIPGCNCRVKESCPMEGKCLTKSIIYRANVTNDQNQDTANYIGLTEHSFKDRLYKHRNSFRYRSKINATELSKHVWNLREKNIANAEINWSILEKAPPFRNGSKRCELCTTEKYHIIFQEFKLLNKRDELLNKCRHINKFLLCNFKETPPDD